MFDLDIGTLTAVFLALLLAIQGVMQRSAQRNAPEPEVLVAECPNNINDLWPALERVGKDAQFCREKWVEILNNKDPDGVPRWQARDQGKVMITLSREILERVSDLEREVEIMNRTAKRNGNGRSSS